MTTWNDFKERATGEHWTIRDGEALWVNEKPPLLAHVRIRVDPTELDPEATRVRTSLSDEDVEFEAYFLREGPVTFQEAKYLSREWVNIWEKPVWLHIIDAPPPGHKYPVPLDFPPGLRKKFKTFKISNTTMAPLWGQDISYFGDRVWEFNAFGRMNNDPKIKWQQTWVEKNLKCPFCGHENWNYTHAHILEEPDAHVYDPEGYFYSLFCPRCDRMVEVVPRALVD